MCKPTVLSTKVQPYRKDIRGDMIFERNKLCKMNSIFSQTVELQTLPNHSKKEYSPNRKQQYYWGGETGVTFQSCHMTDCPLKGNSQKGENYYK